MRKLRQCKCGGDADYEQIESPVHGAAVEIYEQVECLTCERMIILPEGDAPGAAEVWNVLMQPVRLPEVEHDFE